MGIVDITPDYEEQDGVKEQPIYYSKEELKTSTLYNKDNSLDNIIKYIRGNRWTVDYFLQLRDLNDTIAPLDIESPVSIQKYHRIDKLELIVQSAINQDTIDNITGEAIINVGITPNQHDMFRATLTGGREALFLITEVNKRTYNIHETYVVSFKLWIFIDGTEDNSVIYNNLLKKVMKTYVYDKDHLLDYSAPVILASDYKKKVELRETLPVLIDYYLRTFLNYDKNIIALPTEMSIYTDLYLNKFINAIIDQSDHELTARLSPPAFSTGQDAIYTIWDLILYRDVKMFKTIKKYLDFRYNPYTYHAYLNRQINYMGVNFMVNEITDGSKNIDIPYKDISSSRDEGYEEPIAIRDKTYVLSECFYNQDILNCGYLEQMLFKYLHREIINSEDLNKPILEYTSWSTRNQFYLIPILMVLIRDAINNTFKSI